jgi:alpha-amylase/alpha-mannosidase (GH57 family)
MPRSLSAPIQLVLLWHMHQPDYRIPGEPGRAAMPWTRLHAAKDYVDIVELLARNADVRMAVNVVPVLLDQLVDIAAGGTDPLRDASVAAAAGTASEEQAALLVRSAATLPIERMFPESRSLPRLVSTLAAAPDHVGDLLDLAVLLHLAWTGPLVRAEPAIQALIARDGAFSAADLEALLERFDARAAETPAAWARLAKEGTIEFSTTPYNHPILPLLCDLQAAEEARRGCSTDGIVFARPQDAEEQVRSGVHRAAAALEAPVHGMWPSEGSVSEAALAAIRRGAPDLRWLATDRQILAKSLGRDMPADPLRPWRVRGEGPALFFRDTDLSDRIGFVYAGMPADEAVRDFLGGVRRKAAAAEGTATVCVFLDGENCWEHYEGGGEPFLRALVDGLASAEDIDAVTPSEALDHADAAGRTGTLDQLASGSWIRGDFDTWAGHPEKNAAWRRLAGAADALEQARASGVADDQLALARTRLLRAEGSDWFWWLGDDHPTPWKAEFDALFRAHVASVYTALGLEPPPDMVPAGTVAPPAPDAIEVPFAPIQPRLSGEDRGHFAWYGAARLPEGRRDGAMHAGTSSAVRELQYGWDHDHLYVRLLPLSGRLDRVIGGGSVGLEIDDRPLSPSMTDAACGAVWEASIPRADVQGDTLRVVLHTDDGAVLRVPARGPARLYELTPAWTA